MNVGILNRYGAVRLLDTIRNQYPELNICDKIKEIKKSLDNNFRTRIRNPDNRQYENIQPSKTSLTHSNMNNDFRGSRYRSRNETFVRPIRYEENSSNNQERNIQQKTYNSNARRRYSHTGSGTYYPAEHARPPPTTQPPRNNRPGHYHQSRSNQRHQSGISSELDYAPQRYGCHNCGEPNHRVFDCRFDYRIKCKSCYEYGHKTRLCLASI